MLAAAQVAGPGPNFLCWPFQNMAGVLSTRVQQLNVSTDTKTKDNVTVTLVIDSQLAYTVVKTQSNRVALATGVCRTVPSHQRARLRSSGGCPSFLRSSGGPTAGDANGPQ